MAMLDSPLTSDAATRAPVFRAAARTSSTVAAVPPGFNRPSARFSAGQADNSAGNDGDCLGPLDECFLHFRWKARCTSRMLIFHRLQGTTLSRQLVGGGKASNVTGLCHSHNVTAALQKMPEAAVREAQRKFR